MDTILVVNAGSSSLKFQVFAVGAAMSLQCLIKGQVDGIGTRPRLRAVAADKNPLIDRSLPEDEVKDLPDAIHAAGIVLGARVPIVLTSRADSVRTRMASCAVAVLYADAQRGAPVLRAA